MLIYLPSVSCVVELQAFTTMHHLCFFFPYLFLALGSTIYVQQN